MDKHRILTCEVIPNKRDREVVYFLCPHPTDRLKLLGWARLERADGRLWFAVCVDDVHRGGGIGRALLATAAAWSDRTGATISLTSKPHLVAWYASAGFEKRDPPPDVRPAAGQTFMIRAPQP